MRRNCLPPFLKERLKFLVVDGTIICNNIKSLTVCEGESWIHPSHIKTCVNRFLGPSIFKREVLLHYICGFYFLKKRIGFHEVRKNILVYLRMRRHSVVAAVTKATGWKTEES